MIEEMSEEITYMHVKGETQANGSDNIGGSTFFPLCQDLGISIYHSLHHHLPMKMIIHQEHRTTSRRVGDFVNQQLLLYNQQTRTTNTTNHLMRRKEQRITIIISID